LFWVKTSVKEKLVDVVDGCPICFSLEALRNKESKKINNAMLDAWAKKQMHLDQQMVA